MMREHLSDHDGGVTAFPEMTLEETEDVLELIDRYGCSPGQPHTSTRTLGSVLSMVEPMAFTAESREAIERLWSDGWRVLGIGSSRIVFTDGGDVVAKVPLDDRGVYSSIREARISRETGKTGEIPVADCHLDDEYMVLWMERVEPWVTGMTNYPDWAWQVDGFQVGYDREGTLVAYDL